MSRDTLTVGEGRRIVGEILTGLGTEQPKTIDTEQPGDSDPLTIQGFRETMRGGLRSMFEAISQAGSGKGGHDMTRALLPGDALRHELKTSLYHLDLAVLSSGGEVLEHRICELRGECVFILQELGVDSRP